MQDEVISLPRANCDWFKSLSATISQSWKDLEAQMRSVFSVCLFYISDIRWLSRASCLSCLCKNIHCNCVGVLCCHGDILSSHIYRRPQRWAGNEGARRSIPWINLMSSYLYLSAVLEINEVSAHANVSARSRDAFLSSLSPSMRCQLMPCTGGLTAQLANKTKQVEAEMLRGAGWVGFTESGHPLKAAMEPQTCERKQAWSPPSLAAAWIFY